ncbi:hypothetical protein AMECASPLE_031776 [Ameca splendens]|uniref:Uncharacterized protein n=1 Tax=Ameca splendens TaxID=208324 RepID=A0ABV0ZR84_9TELE
MRENGVQAGEGEDGATAFLVGFVDKPSLCGNGIRACWLGEVPRWFQSDLVTGGLRRVCCQHFSAGVLSISGDPGIWIRSFLGFFDFVFKFQDIYLVLSPDWWWSAPSS